MKIVVHIGARALAGANDGIDPWASAFRYGDAVREALAREWPEASIEIEVLEGGASTRIEVLDVSDLSGERDPSRPGDDSRARAVERLALDLAWAVKGCADWAVR